jgi:hypothetical protein
VIHESSHMDFSQIVVLVALILRTRWELSLEFNHPSISPFAILKPLLTASACPSSGSDTHFILSLYFLSISTVLSVEPPSITIYSIFG